MNRLEEFDRVYSLYIRLRDAGEYGYTKCISCGKVLPFEKMQCGHFFTRHHLATRWDEDNCNSECSICNCNDVHHLEGYRKHLIEKIGLERFMALDERHKEEGSLPTEEEYRILISGYKECCRKLARMKGISISV